MKVLPSVRCAVLISILCTLAACSQGNSSRAASPASDSAAPGGGGWASNGATACEMYLTPEFVGEIFENPAGHAKKLSAQSCSFETPDLASIAITLIAGGPAAFDAHQPYLADPVPLPGVGDKAVRTAIGGIEAVKGNNRMCDVDVTPPFASRLKGEALALKLGEVCNKVFALP